MIGSFHWPTNESRTKDLIVANQHTEKTLFLAQNVHFKVFSVKISQKRPKTTHQIRKDSVLPADSKIYFYLMTHQLWLSIYDSKTYDSRNVFLIEIKKAIFSPKEALVIEKDPEMATGSTSGHFYKLEKIRRVGKNVTFDVSCQF